MKPIRMFILFAIGMIAFTGTANTTANLGQKQKVELVSEFIAPTFNLQVVEINKQVTIPQAISCAVEVKSQNLKNENSKQSYKVSKDVGWRCSQTILYYTEKEVAGDKILNLHNTFTDVGKESLPIITNIIQEQNFTRIVVYRVLKKPIYKQSNYC